MEGGVLVAVVELSVYAARMEVAIATTDAIRARDGTSDNRG